MSFLEGAIIGAIAGLVMAIYIAVTKNQKYKKLILTVSPAPEYSALYHYASPKRFKKSVKFFDSYGAFYVVGNKAYYKSSAKAAPIEFDLASTLIVSEPDWRRLKWFSLTTATGEKYYFDSHKMGFISNDSSETLKGLAFLQEKQRKITGSVF
jgi:hypothetical protein